MQTNSFIKFLMERNRSFIDQMSSESALGLIDHSRSNASMKKQCIVISFDPPLGYPPFAFNWNSSEVCYFNEPALSPEFYKKVEAVYLNAEQPFIIFVERKNPLYKRKILRWIKGFREVSFRNKPLSEQPIFLLAEYSGPLFHMDIREIKGSE